MEINKVIKKERQRNNWIKRKKDRNMNKHIDKSITKLNNQVKSGIPCQIITRSKLVNCKNYYINLRLSISSF